MIIKLLDSIWDVGIFALLYELYVKFDALNWRGMETYAFALVAGVSVFLANEVRDWSRKGDPK